MVEITKLNFEDMLPHVETSIKNSSMIAIDAEFTGLSLGPENDIKLFDTLNTRYLKLKSRASNFIPCQIGLSTFTKHQTENLYLVESFVFYIRPCWTGSTDKNFMCQASCVEFLNRYNFDFNKFFKDGIPYINEIEEQQIRKEIQDGSIQYSYKKTADIRLLKKQDMLINSFVNKLHPISENTGSNASEEEQLVLDKDATIPDYFQLNDLRLKYPSLWAYAEDEKIILKKVSPTKRQEFEKQVQSEEERLLKYFLGFTRVFRIMKEVKKPIVGHNELMDLLLLFHHFHKPLPETFLEFKKELHNLFPVIYDTRHVWRWVKKHYQLKNIPKECGLFDLQEMLKRVPEVFPTLFSPNFQHCNNTKYLTEHFAHDSGYDSFVTGWVFLKICHVLAMKIVKSKVHIQPQTFKQHLNAAAPFKNKLNIGRSREYYIDLENEDPQPVVLDLLHIRKIYKNSLLNQEQLYQLLNSYGMIDIKLLGSKTAAVIAVGSLGSYNRILKDFEQNSDFKVEKYSVLKHTPIVNSVLWMTVIGTGCMVAFLVVKLFK